MVRQRNVDRILLDQSSSDILLDEDDQQNIINQLTIENFTSFMKFRRYISYLLLIELTAILSLPISLKGKLLLNLSLALSLVDVNSERFNMRAQWVKYGQYSNWLLSLVLVGTTIIRWSVNDLYTLLPLFNLLSYYICRNCYVNIDEGVTQLTTFKYKYKSV